jgi:isopentenyl diphosphate isomerase/L-lactate dehydrogenase-like FMN-dependent dehydrogenase
MPDDPLGGLFSLDALEAVAEKRLSPVAFAYVAGGAWDEWTLRENVAAFRRRRLWPRVLVDVSSVDTRLEILGREAALPLGLAPASIPGRSPAGDVR